MVVVAMGFVSEARSNSVTGVMGKSKSPPGREERDKNEAPSRSWWKMGVPNAFSATSLPAYVTATEAAGKERAAIAVSINENADAKTSSWLS